jgi:tripartite-type tricarboxylate transporter receptor subunit TctC
MARHIGKHIPGNPTIIVQNMPAAESIAATNYMFATAPKDGTVIALVQRGMLLAKLIHPAGVRFDIEKLSWIGSLSNETAVTLAWHTAPHKSAADLFDKELIVGANAGADPETTARLYNSLIGTKFKIITGYDGTTQITLAIERGEVQGRADWAWGSLKSVKSDWLSDKKVTVLMQGALKNEPELGDIPNALDFVKTPEDRKVMELHFTQKTAARPVVAPPGIPEGRLAVLRSAFMALSRDPEFLAEGDKARMEIAPISGEEVDKIVALIVGTPRDIAERFTKAFDPAQPQ